MAEREGRGCNCFKARIHCSALGKHQGWYLQTSSRLEGYTRMEEQRTCPDAFRPLDSGVKTER